MRMSNKDSPLSISNETSQRISASQLPLLCAAAIPAVTKASYLQRLAGMILFFKCQAEGPRGDFPLILIRLGPCMAQTSKYYLSVWFPTMLHRLER